MSAQPSQPPASTRSPEADHLLRMLESQFSAIQKRLPDDVKSAMIDANNAGFLNYFLYDEKGDALSEECLQKYSISRENMEALPSFAQICKICDKKYCRLIFEHYLDFRNPNSGRLLKLTVDGW